MATTTTEIEPEVETEAEFPSHRMTIDRDTRLVEAGVYGPRDPVFLGMGRLVEKMPKGPLHWFPTTMLMTLLVRMLPEGWHAAQEVPLKIGPISMPEPDVMVVRGELEIDRDRPRTESDVAIVVEVSDSSLAQDWGPKSRAYAVDGVPIYWIVNLPRRRVLVHSRPSGPGLAPGYRECQEYQLGDAIPIVLDNVEVGRVEVSSILPGVSQGR